MQPRRDTASTNAETDDRGILSPELARRYLLTNSMDARLVSIAGEDVLCLELLPACQRGSRDTL